MAEIKKFFEKLNPFWEHKKYNIPLWQCPSFLFVLMGVIIMGAIIAAYYIASLKIKDPRLVSLIVLAVAFILIVIDYIITKSFEKVSEANKMKTEFISVVSHQLRAPLTNLRYVIQVLISEKIKKFSRKEIEYFKILEENTEKMGDLINNLLIVSRLETKEVIMKKEEFSLPDLVKKLILRFKSFSEASNIKIKLRAEKNIPPVLADSFWTEQIVSNLLDNAVRYTKEEGVVEIKVRMADKKVYFEIHDSGVGIPKEEQKYIFQKFFRSKNVLKYQTQGSGLGLHICKELIGLMEGKIWFKSQEKKGTSFYFTLPIIERRIKKV